MKIVATTTTIALAALALGAAPALAQSGPEVEIQHAVARVVVIVENRTDIGVEIQQGASGLPALRVERRGNDVRIDGGLRRRVAGFSVSDRIEDCRSGPNRSGRPGDGASVQVDGIGRINLSNAPMVVIRAPRDVKVEAGAAVYGSIGRGAASVSLGSGGCGDWDVANTDGPVEIALGGSGQVRIGTSRTLDVALGGSGALSAGATTTFELALGGSGEASVAAVNGDVDISIGGSGEVSIRGGRAPNMNIAIGGSGDIDFGGTAGDVDVAIMGSGDVRIAAVTGEISRSIAGSGDIRVGR